MVKIDRSELSAVAEDFKKQSVTAKLWLEKLDIAFQIIIIDDKFRGQGPTNFKNYLSDGIANVSRQLSILVPETATLLQQLDSSFEEIDKSSDAVIGTGRLGSLVSQANKLNNNTQDAIKNMNSAIKLANGVSDVEITSVSGDEVDDAGKKFVELLNNLTDEVKQWDVKNQYIFSEVSKRLKAVGQMLSQIKELSLGEGGLEYNRNSDLAKQLAFLNERASSFKKLSFAQIRSQVGEIKRPKGMSDVDYITYKTAVYKSLLDLSEKGWTMPSLKACVGYLNKESTSQNEDDLDPKDLVTELIKPANMIGSDLFKKMWYADTPSESANQEIKEVQSQRKLKILMNIMDMPVQDLVGMKKQTKELLSHFDSNLKPNDKFWISLAETTQMAYPDGIAEWKGDVDLRQQMHQFRYVISAQQAQYVRDNYQKKGMTDRDALIAYLQDERKKAPNVKARRELYKTSSARLHNKVDKNFKAPDDAEGTNIKVLMSFHTEFIVSEDGDFLNEIDPEREGKKNLQGVVNGGSFNYGNENDGTHDKLDVNYEVYSDPKNKTKDNLIRNFDPEFRKKMTAGYSSPPKDAYFEPKTDDDISHYGDSENHLSGSQVNKNKAEEFDREVKGGGPFAWLRDIFYG